MDAFTKIGLTTVLLFLFFSMIEVTAALAFPAKLRFQRIPTIFGNASPLKNQLVALVIQKAAQHQIMVSHALMGLKVFAQPMRDVQAHLQDPLFLA